jgi:hypothetical protein
MFPLIKDGRFAFATTPLGVLGMDSWRKIAIALIKGATGHFERYLFTLTMPQFRLRHSDLLDSRTRGYGRQKIS